MRGSRSAAAGGSLRSQNLSTSSLFARAHLELNVPLFRSVPCNLEDIGVERHALHMADTQPVVADTKKVLSPVGVRIELQFVQPQPLPFA